MEKHKDNKLTLDNLKLGATAKGQDVALCGKMYGTGRGGTRRICHLPANHSGRCTDLPFLRHLKTVKPKVASKIERDAFNTRGASWGKTLDGTQARKNREVRWTLTPGHSLYPRQHQTYELCLIVAAEMTLQAYEMPGAPVCPEEDSVYLQRVPERGSWVCPICKFPIEFKEFDLAEQSKAAVDTDHLNPTIERRHAPGNVAFVHHICNTSKGDRSLEEFEEWMIKVLTNYGHKVV